MRVNIITNGITSSSRAYVDKLTAAGLTLIWMLARSKYIERRLNKVIARILLYWGEFQVRDYVAILHLEEGYSVSELAIESNDWLAEKSLVDLKLPDEGVLVLGIRRKNGTFLATPTAETAIHAADTLILYGPTGRIEELDQRRRGQRGDRAHRDAVGEQEAKLAEQEVINMREEHQRAPESAARADD